MAPEVARRQPIVNHKAVDSYGLGCIAHDLAHAGTCVDDEPHTPESGVTCAFTTLDSCNSPVVLVIKRASCAALETRGRGRGRRSLAHNRAQPRPPAGGPLF